MVIIWIGYVFLNIKFIFIYFLIFFWNLWLYKSNVYLLLEFFFYNVFLFWKLWCGSSDVNLMSVFNFNFFIYWFYSFYSFYWFYIGFYDVSIVVFFIGGVVIVYGFWFWLIIGVYVYYVFMVESFKFVVLDVLFFLVGF